MCLLLVFERRHKGNYRKTDFTRILHTDKIIYMCKNFALRFTGLGVNASKYVASDGATPLKDAKYILGHT